MDTIPFPDPALGDVQSCRRCLQACQPDGLALSSVFQYRVGLSKYTWIATYSRTGPQFPDPNAFDKDQAKSIFQRRAPRQARVSTVGTQMDINGTNRWSVIYLYQRCHTITIKDFIPTKIYERIVPKKETPKTKRPSFKLTENRPRSVSGQNNSSLTSCNVRVKRKGEITFVHPNEIQPEDIPQKVFYGNIDLTRKFCGKTRFCRGTFQQFMKDFKMSTETPESKPDVDNSHSKTGIVITNNKSEETGAKDKCLNQQYKAVPYSYHNLERTYQKAKLTDEKVLNLVHDYIAAVRLGLPHGYAPLKAVFSSPVLTRKLKIQSLGLPCDENLFDIYLDFATSLGNDRFEIISELESRYQFLKKNEKEMLF